MTEPLWVLTERAVWQIDWDRTLIRRVVGIVSPTPLIAPDGAWHQFDHLEVGPMAAPHPE